MCKTILHESIRDDCYQSQSLETLTSENITPVQEELLTDKNLKIKEIVAKFDVFGSTALCILFNIFL